MLPRLAVPLVAVLATVGIPCGFRLPPLFHKPLRCAALNPVGAHSDVAAGLVWAFQEAGCNMSSYIINEFAIKVRFEVHEAYPLPKPRLLPFVGRHGAVVQGRLPRR